jgi:hypothetical protein
VLKQVILPLQLSRLHAVSPLQWFVFKAVFSLLIEIPFFYQVMISRPIQHHNTQL